jgi:hypothetical protein
VKKFDSHQRQLNAIRTAPAIRNAVISAGGQLTVLDNSGNVVGQLGHDSFGNRGFSLSSAAGVVMFDFGILGVGNPGLAILDSTGNECLVTDPNGDGSGLWWPWIPITMAPMTISLWPFNTTGSFVTIAQGASETSSQRIYMACRAICDSGATAGEARLLVNGSQVGSTVSIGTSAQDAIFGPVNHGVASTTAVIVSLQTRVTAGAGNCRAIPYWSTWINSTGP